MGLGWARAALEVAREALSPSRPFTLTLPADNLATFDSPPRPVDQLISEMLSSGWNARVTRGDALSLAAVQRGRNEICAISTLPLRMFRGLEVVESPLLRQINPNVPNVVTLSHTLEDLLFEGIAWWRVLGTDFDRYPIVAEHVDVNRVSLNPPTGSRQPNTTPAGYIAPGTAGASVWVDGNEVAASQMIRFDSPNPGLLTGRGIGRTIRRALLLDLLAATYADNPRPLDYFTDKADAQVDPMEEDEIPGFLAEWRALRKAAGTAWIPGNVERVDVNAPSPAELQLVELQRQATLEIANGLGVDPEDLGVSTTSRTYFNGVDRRQEKINRTYAPYMLAITDRLSMGDVTRRGYVVKFDPTDYLKSDPLTQAQYLEALQRMGAINAAEVRAAAGWSGRPPADAGTVSRETSPALAARPPLQLGDITPPQLPGARFDGPATLQFAAADFAGSTSTPTVDTARRTISGLALPYNAIASKYGMRLRFRPGSLEYDADQLQRIKHLRDHAVPMGNTLEVDDQADGMHVTLSVLDGPEGSSAKADRDQLLYDAEHGLYDGLSVGVEFSWNPDDGDIEYNADEQVYDVLRASWRETSSTPIPAFTDARVDRVAASNHTGGTMHCQHCGHSHAPGISCAAFARQLAGTATMTAPTPNPAPTPTPPTPPTDPAPGAPTGPGVLPGTALLSAEQLQQLAQAFGQMALGNGPAAVSPHHGPAIVREPSPYWLDRRGQLRRGSHDFSTDLFAGWREGGGGDLGARDRANGFISSVFSDLDSAAQFAVTPANVAALNPNRNRPDLYVDQWEYEYPLWNAVNGGTLEDITPFVVPKYNTSSGLVADHVTGTEPTPGAFTATAQTITPTAVSGKVEYTREAYDQGGNPQASTLIFRQMVRAYFEALEAYAVAQFVANAASITDLTLTTAAVDSALDQNITNTLVPLQYLRGGDRFRTVFTQIDLYKAMTAAKDSSGRRLYPQQDLGVMNAMGTQRPGYTALEAHGKLWLPAWALAATGTVAQSSYMFDPERVMGWATPPRQINLEWRVAWVDIGIWGYKAFAFLDFNAARELVYDPV